MKIIPWRRDGDSLSQSLDLENLWSRFLRNDSGELMSHLPEAFRNHLLPAVNISESEDSFCVMMDCPGLDDDDFQVEFMGSQLVISGERKWENEKKGKDFHRVESQFGRFERTIQLPENTRHDPDCIEATYKKGILKVIVPKVEKTPSAKIPVHSD